MTSTPPAPPRPASAPSRGDGSRLQRLNALLEHALALDSVDREQWLQHLPAALQVDLPDLRVLLARAEIETDAFLSQPLSLRFDHDGIAGQTGDVVAGYRLLRPVQGSPQAPGWLALHQARPDAPPVLLRLPQVPDWRGDPQRLARSSAQLARVRHPGLARLLAAGVTIHGRPWAAMEWVEGLPIDRHCRTVGLDIRQRLRLLLQACDALATAHAQQWSHRSLQVDSLWVTPDGRVMVQDFGIGQMLFDAAAPASRTDHPGRERRRASRPSDARTGDVHALGLVLDHLLADRGPLPATLVSLVQAAMGCDPVVHHADAGALSQALRRWLDEAPGTQTRPPRPNPWTAACLRVCRCARARHWCRTWALLVVLLLAFALVLALAAAWSGA
jgi:eukaryotic-like serine/threonine-protein kinase